jgi:hypothetical protein
MSDSSRTRIIRLTESGFAVAPAANPATKLTRFLSESLGHQSATIVSDEIRSDRQRGGSTLVNLQSQGDIAIEVVYAGIFEEWLEAVLCGTWGTPSTDKLRNGVTDRSFLYEVGFMDIVKFIKFPGMTVDKLSLDITAKQQVKATANFMGAPGVAAATSVAGTTAPTAANSNQPMAAGPGIGFFNTGGANLELVGVSAQSLKLEISNNLRSHDLATSLTTDDYGRGVMNISGSLNTYFKDIAIYNQFVADGLFALGFTMKDPLLVTNNAYKFTLPSLKVNGAPVTIPGVDRDVMQVIYFQAFADSAVGYAIEVERNVDL